MPKSPKSHLLSMLLKSAYGFYQASLSCINHLKGQEDPSFATLSQFLPVAATNLSFCIELLLKAVHIMNKGHVSGHSLYSLFKKLPEDQKNEIESIFEKYKANLSGKKLFAFRVEFYKANASRPIQSNAAANLEDLLQSHQNNFVKWRYIYEIENGYGIFEIDFDLLECFAQALKEFINTNGQDLLNRSGQSIY